MPWNTGSHRRKFLSAGGACTDDTGRVKSGTIAFWGEWESPSRVRQKFSPTAGLPHYLHEPLPPNDVPAGFRQNTDPWVFGPTFLYSNCKQLTPHGKPSALQRLARGSVILFGSSIDGRFCHDTVFVVAGAERFSRADSDHLDVPEIYRKATLESLRTTRRVDQRHVELTLYRGATAVEPVEGMFSFIPAQPADADVVRFRRPVYDDESVAAQGFVNHASKQSPLGAKRLRPIEEVQLAWDVAWQSVLDAGLVLGVSVALPTE